VPSSQGLPDPDGWVESSDWLSRARRLGPLRYSDLGRRVFEPVPDVAIERLAAHVSERADAWWEAAGFPDPFTLVVVSGDDGRLAAAVLNAELKCATALRYVVVNPDVEGRTEPPARLVELVALEDPVFLYPARRRPPVDALESDEYLDDDDLDDPLQRPPARSIGPLATFLTGVPALSEGDGALVAIGILSRLPFDLYEWGDGGWSEVRVAADGDELREMALPVADESAGLPDIVATAAHPAPRWARQTGAADWLRRVVPSAKATYLTVIDEWSGPEGVDLDQLRPIREPLDGDPVPVGGTPYSAVTWRL
jgi:hypothetical protein